MILRKIVRDDYIVYKDEYNRTQGEYIEYWEGSDILHFYSFYKNGMRHGEWRRYNMNGILTYNVLYVNGEQILDATNLTKEDKLLISLTYGDIQWCNLDHIAYKQRLC